MTYATTAQPPLLNDLSLSYRLFNAAQDTGDQRLLLLQGVGGNVLNLIPVGERLADAHNLVLSIRATGFRSGGLRLLLG
jgi:phospholipase/carboxylesterase